MPAANAAEFTRLVHLVEGGLPEGEARALKETVEEADDATLASLFWLRAFGRMREGDPPDSPPPEVRDALVRRFEARRDGRAHEGEEGGTRV